MNTKFSCDKTAAKVMVMLFHYQLKGKGGLHDLKSSLKKTINIELSGLSKKPLNKAVKKHLMAQEIQDLYSNKKLNRFCFVGIYKTDYYTIKSNDNKKKGIKTRLMVLSCGHQLGFDLIDKFLKNYHMNYSIRVLLINVLSRFLGVTMQLY
jgi:hypothetical protein